MKQNETKAYKHEHIILFAFSVCNLLFMHYYIIISCSVEMPLEATSFIDNLCSVLFESLALLILFYYIFLKKIKYALNTLFYITLTWSFCNILYSRFFLRYLTLSSIGQADNLLDYSMIMCIIDGVSLVDLYYIIAPFIYYYVYKSINYTNQKPISLPRILLIFPILIIFNLFAHTLFCCSNSKLWYVSYYKERLYNIHFIIDYNLGRPNWANYHRGTIRTLIAEIIIMQKNSIKLTDNQLAKIQEVIVNQPNPKIEDKSTGQNTKNIIFILVESYLSLATDLIIDGKEVMPFLNTLRKQTGTYYNGSLRSNITLGQSSDGQFIYMTGLLPLRSILTISKAKNISLPGLPKILSRQFPNMKSRMVIPTLPSLWEQESMCLAYGFDSLFSSYDYNEDKKSQLSDEEMFELSARIDKTSSEPFFSILLTMAMHSPYNHEFDTEFHISKYDESMNYYLNACHYTDKQIGKYFTHLKKSGLYEKSIIIIASDHQALDNFVDVEQYGFNRNLPLFIVNADLAPNKIWSGEANQIDVYPTLLDILNIRSPWRGIGHSITSTSYQNTISTQKWDISEWIIFGNYFKNHSY